MEFSETDMNISALKRLDPYFKDLLQTAGHVALYNFNTVENEWEKTEVEGALFVYSRTGKPFHNILIMSRLSTKNFVEPVIDGLDLHLEDPYLLYKTGEGSIFCLWFYDKDECNRINQVLIKILKGTDGRMESKMPDRVEGNAFGVDLFSMLTKAQEEYNSASKNSEDKTKESDNTPKSVKDFFMKASQGSHFQNGQTPQMPGFMGASGSQQPMPPQGLDSLPEPLSVQPKPLPLLEKIMLDPQNSVQHIEKQHITATPQNELAAFIRASQEQKKMEMEKQQPSTATAPPDLNDVQSNFRFMRISDATSPTDTVQTVNFFNSNLSKVMPTKPAVEHQSPANEDSAPPAPNKTLMTPMMFSSPKKKTTRTPSNKVEPLTKEQILQAVQYLINNDPDFIQKIHEAYVKSFNA